MTQRYDFLLTAVDAFEPSYFEDKILVWFFQTMKTHFLNFQDMPTVDVVLCNELRKAAATGAIKPAEFQSYADVCGHMRQRVNAQNYVINEVVRFCRRQAGRQIYLDTAPLMDTADDKTWDEIVDKIVQVTKIGSSYLDMGSDFFATAKERVRIRATGDSKLIVPVGIDELDQRLGGGLKGGQLGVWMGGTGAGKSISLCHCGNRAAIRGFKVVHYTLELDEVDVGDRYDALWTQTPIHELRTSSVQVLRALEYCGQQVALRGGRLLVKSYPTGTASVNTLRSHLKQLEASGWRPDLIIVDYLDLLKPLTNYQDEYADLGAIATSLRGLAGDMQVPVWTATQANRPGMQAEVIDVEHIGDSFKKAQIADVILALCANREELASNVMRIFGAKNRNGPAKFVIRINSAYNRMTLHDLGKAAIPALPTVPAAAPPGMPAAAQRRRKVSPVT